MLQLRRRSDQRRLAAAPTSRVLLEHDTAITGAEPPVGRGPVDDVRASVDVLDRLAPTEGGTG